MNKSIAKDKDGKLVYGWYCKVGERHMVVLPTAEEMLDSMDPDRFDVGPVAEIDISSAAVATGGKDKNGVEIYGSKGEMQGGDVVKANIYSDETPQELSVQWLSGAWVIEYEDSESDLSLIFDFAGTLKIISQEDK